VPITLLADHGQEVGAHLAVQLGHGQIPTASCGRRLGSYRDRLADAHRHAGLGDLGRDAADLKALRFEQVPVHEQHPTLRQVRHQPLGNEVACAIEAGLAGSRVEFTETAADGYVRADDQDHVREACITAVVHLVEDAPGCQHPHDRRLARACRHLAAEASERREAVRLPFAARLVYWDSDALPEVRAGLGQEDDRLHGVELGEEQPRMSAVARPILEQLPSSA
jgi:hypothetical protein